MGLGGMLDGMMGGGGSPGGGMNIRPGNTGVLSQFQGSLKDMTHAQRAAHFPGFVDGQTAPPPGWGGITINEAQSTQNLDPLFAQARATGQTDFSGPTSRDPLNKLWSNAGDVTGGVADTRKQFWRDQNHEFGARPTSNRALANMNVKSGFGDTPMHYYRPEPVAAPPQPGILSTMEQQANSNPAPYTTQHPNYQQGGTPESPYEERGGQRGQQGQEEEEQPMTPEEAGRRIRDPLDYLALTAQERENRFAKGMTSPADLMQRAGGYPVSPAEERGGFVSWPGVLGPRNPPQRSGMPPIGRLSPEAAGSLSERLDELARQLEGNPNSMWGF